MKSLKIILIILILFIFLNLIADVKEEKITTKSVFDIRAVQVVGSRVSISIDANAPNVFISSPLNTTYNYNTSINLNFTAFDDISDISKIWYNLDNGNNITITGNTTFNISEGGHKLYLFVNDSMGHLNNSKFISFNVNTSLGYNITSSEFSGSTTDFNCLTKSRQQSIENVVLHVPSHGKIRFNEGICITSDTNINNYIEIGENSIIIDSNNLPSFNKSASLELYNLTLTNPKIQKDGIDCPSTICLINSYSSGTLSFNVTHFTEYSAAETATNGTPSTGGSIGGSSSGGGSRGGSGIITDPISVFKDSIKIKLEQDGEFSYFLKVKNNWGKKLNLNMRIEPSLDFISIEEGANEYSLDIYSLEKRNIEFMISAIDLKEGIYVSKLIIETNNFEITLPIVVEVVSKGPKLLDVKIDIPPEFNVVGVGEKIRSNILLFNLGAKGKIDCEIEYSILDLDGNVIIGDKESLSVETQSQKMKEFKLPSYIKSGNYIFSVKVTYLDEDKQRVNTATSIFEVTEKKELEFPYSFGLNSYGLILITLALLIIIIIFIIYQFRVLNILKRIYHLRKRRGNKTFKRRKRLRKIRRR